MRICSSLLTRINEWVKWLKAALTNVVGVSLIWVHLIEMRLLHVVELANAVHHHVLLALWRISVGLLLAVRLNLLREHRIQMSHLWREREEEMINIESFWVLEANEEVSSTNSISINFFPLFRVSSKFDSEFVRLSFDFNSLSFFHVSIAFPPDDAVYLSPILLLFLSPSPFDLNWIFPNLFLSVVRPLNHSFSERVCSTAGAVKVGAEILCASYVHSLSAK